MAYSNEKAVTVFGGIGFLDALTLLFVALKLLKVIDWSWWWVLAPFWGQFALAIVGCVFIGLIYLFIAIGDAIFDKKHL